MKLYHKISGTGTPLIILHGLFGMTDNWRTIVKMLEDQFMCILVDLRNHGRSPHSDEMNYNRMADDINELMHELELPAAVLMGHSMGGKVVMQFALDHPEKADKLIVVDISPREYPPHHETVLQAIQSVDLPAIKKRSDAEKPLRHHLGDDEETIQFLLKNLSRHTDGTYTWKANMDVLADRYDDLMKKVGNGSTFDKPTLIIKGEKSNSIRERDWPGIQKLFPQAQLVEIPGAGHWVHADQPQALVRAIVAFINS